MSFWSVASPLATIGATYAGGPWAGAAVGAATGAMAAQERRKQLEDRQQQTAQAAADAIRVSYGRKNGVGSIPQVDYAGGSEAGDTATGAFGGGLQGFSLGMMANKMNQPTPAPTPYGPQDLTQTPDWEQMMQQQKQLPASNTNFYSSGFRRG